MKCSIFEVGVSNRVTTDKYRTLTCFCCLSMFISLFLSNRKCTLNCYGLMFSENHFRGKNKIKKCTSFYLGGVDRGWVIFEVLQNDERFMSHILLFSCNSGEQFIAANKYSWYHLLEGKN